MPSSFVLVYHRSPFDEVIDADGTAAGRTKSPNGIIPTLRNLFRDHPSGTWIAWQDEDSNGADETTVIEEPLPIRLRRIPLQQEQISSFYHVTSKESAWPILHTFQATSTSITPTGPHSRK